MNNSATNRSGRSSSIASIATRGRSSVKERPAEWGLDVRRHAMATSEGPTGVNQRKTRPSSVVRSGTSLPSPGSTARFHGASSTRLGPRSSRRTVNVDLPTSTPSSHRARWVARSTRPRSFAASPASSRTFFARSSNSAGRSEISSVPLGNHFPTSEAGALTRTTSGGAAAIEAMIAAIRLQAMTAATGPRITGVSPSPRSRATARRGPPGR